MLNKDQIEITDDFLSVIINDEFLSAPEKIHIIVEAERITKDDAETEKFLDSINYFLIHKSIFEKLVIEKISEYYSNKILAKKVLYEQTFGISLENIQSPEEIGHLIRLTKIYIDIENDVPTNIGLSFNCYWDSEHGLGLKLKSLSECKIGGADIAFLL